HAVPVTRAADYRCVGDFMLARPDGPPSDPGVLLSRRIVHHIARRTGDLDAALSRAAFDYLVAGSGLSECPDFHARRDHSAGALRPGIYRVCVSHVPREDPAGRGLSLSPRRVAQCLLQLIDQRLGSLPTPRCVVEIVQEDSLLGNDELGASVVLPE